MGAQNQSTRTARNIVFNYLLPTVGLAAFSFLMYFHQKFLQRCFSSLNVVQVFKTRQISDKNVHLHTHLSKGIQKKMLDAWNFKNSTADASDKNLHQLFRTNILVSSKEQRFLVVVLMVGLSLDNYKKAPVSESLFYEVAGLQPYSREILARYFSVNFAKLLRALFF